MWTPIFGQSNYKLEQTTVVSIDFSGTYVLDPTPLTDPVSGNTFYELIGPAEAGPNMNQYKMTYMDVGILFAGGPIGSRGWVVLPIGSTSDYLIASGSENFFPSPPTTGWVGPAGLANGSLLPVEFLYFQGKSQNDAIQLDWATSTESNNKGFEVQHSQDARTWTALDFVEGVGTTVQTQQYGYWHESPVNGYNYYRLKQMDYDGAFDFSDMVEVNIRKKENIRAYPNPVREQVNIILPATNNTAETVEVQWIDMLGRSLPQQMPAVTDGEPLVLPVPTDLPNGLYILQLRLGQEIYQTSIQKQ